MTQTAFPMIVGHRGAALLEPENTLRSFRRAIADGADAVECDVHLSKDGHVIVIHDESIDRTVDPSSPITTGEIAELTRAELDTVILEGGEKVPSLQEVLDLLQREDGTAIEVLVEVKAEEAAEAVAHQLKEHVEERGGKASVISFYPKALAAVRRIAPTVPVGLLAVTTGNLTVAVPESTLPAIDVWAELVNLHAERLSLAIDGVQEEDGPEAGNRNATLHIWTANTEEQVRKAVKLGVASITTDDPKWARALVEQIFSEES